MLSAHSGVCASSQSVVDRGLKMRARSAGTQSKGAAQGGGASAKSLGAGP